MYCVGQRTSIFEVQSRIEGCVWQWKKQMKDESMRVWVKERGYEVWG